MVIVCSTWSMDPFNNPRLNAFITKCSTSLSDNLVAMETSLNEIVLIDFEKTSSTKVIKQIFCLKNGSDSFNMVDFDKFDNNSENLFKSPEFKEFNNFINHSCSVDCKVCNIGCVNNSPKL
ncbi:hypothetical protein WICMUC_002374 [Wickerhamomyces mucosus]|uniref:Uncharacterized protein n=1 Tax=Wickerhamomyces mucosus TaxID=1378264 RepID=A0A9P8PR49_9ASCO|nr:hypothetical protein WICMUC_002374 [Wickerhamomyces mucosus]